MRRALPRVSAFVLAALAACHGNDTPRDSHVVLTHDSRRAVVTGVAGGARPTLDLAPGCGGFVAEGPPDQVIEVRQPMKLDFVARSTRGPVSLVVVGDDGALCDGDGGTGHAPRIHTVAPGRYRVWVASMHANEHLPYELTVAPASKEEAAGPTVAGGGPAGAGATISVSVMSTPPGAEVRSPTGQVMGQTPAMFEFPAPALPSGTLAFVVDAPGRQAATVSGTPVHGELVLNAVLGGAPVALGGGGTPTVGMEGALTQVANVPQRIRDYGTATQTIAWPNSCTIANLTVDTVIRHTCLSDLRVRLASPSGTTVTLHDHSYRNTLTRTWTASDAHGALGRLVGQEAQGTWTMTVRDDVDADSGNFESFTVHIVCAGGGTVTASATPAAGGGGIIGLGGTIGPSPMQPRGPAQTRDGVLDPWH